VRRKTTADDVRQVLLSAVADALDEGKQEARKKPGLTGVRAVATGAMLYTAGRATIAGRRFYRDHFGADGREDAEEHDEDGDEPEAVAEDEEPRAEGDEERYDDDEYADEEYFDEDEEPGSDPADRPPVHSGAGENGHADPDLPQRPSRARRPVRK
jgi:hypothetical protein